MEILKIKDKSYKHKEKITCLIKDNLLLDCVLSINDKPDTNGRRYFICHNNNSLDGSAAFDKLGYKYSWTFDNNNGELTQYVKIIDSIESKDNVTISDEIILLKDFKYKIIDLFLLKKGKFSNFNKLETSEKEGFVKISNDEDNKSFEIKFGRFMKSIIDENQDVIKMLGIIVDNLYIENFHNDFITIQNKHKMSFEILKGDDILKGYTRDNYYAQSSNLWTSCMVNKHSYLQLYTKNKNVSLAVLLYDGKICARCLIWNDEYFDKVYSNYDWCSACLKNFLKNYKKINVNLTINIEFIPQFFPYVDTLLYLNKEKKTISNIESNSPRMRNTNGTLC